MAESMAEGLAAEGCTLPMIPTYLKNSGAVPLMENAVVIDAGGTNFRCALVRFTGAGAEVSEMSKCRMPGIGEPCTWEEFIRFAADRIEPLMDRANVIGFCFSYSAVITPERDGRVIAIDKEVVITGCEGQLVGASLLAELEHRGITGKRAVILNDTVAVLLGGAAPLDKGAYSGFIGQVSGTGTNTCVSLPVSQIGKLGQSGERGMVVNLESGEYDGIAGGDYDWTLDAGSHAPGTKRFEKLTAGVYLGQLARLMLRGAADEGLLSEDCAAHVRALPLIDSSVIDAWASGEGFSLLGGDEADHAFAREISLALFRRSARCMCVNLLALTELAGGGRDKPMCVLAEGSLVQKGRHYRPELEHLLMLYGLQARGLKLELHVGEETTIPGSAAAALLNA
jgi:hexokinase